jgi:hypothetical protein
MIIFIINDVFGPVGGQNGWMLLDSCNLCQVRNWGPENPNPLLPGSWRARMSWQRRSSKHAGDIKGANL